MKPSNYRKNTHTQRYKKTIFSMTQNKVNRSMNNVFKSPTKSKSKTKKGLWTFLGFKSLH